ncbi:MAG: hypothetical protein ACJ76F_03265 [Bacteroidia bacterium]
MERKYRQGYYFSHKGTRESPETGAKKRFILVKKQDKNKMEPSTGFVLTIAAAAVNTPMNVLKNVTIRGGEKNYEKKLKDEIKLRLNKRYPALKKSADDALGELIFYLLLLIFLILTYLLALALVAIFPVLPIKPALWIAGIFWGVLFILGIIWAANS